MPFKSLLKELISSVEDASAAMILESDGEAVQWCAAGDEERLRLRAAYIAVVFQACRASSDRLKLGSVTHLIIEYDGAWFVVGEIERSYFILLELNSSANIGEAVYRIKPAITKLRRDLAV